MVRKLALFAAVALCSVPALAATPATTKASFTTTIAAFVDGDTFVMSKHWTLVPKLNWEIRIRGIDTPEKTVFAGAKCPEEITLGLAASAYAKVLVQQHGVTVKLANVDFDKYGGRFDADVNFADGTSWAQAMIAGGYAKPYFGIGPKPDWCAAPAPAM